MKMENGGWNGKQLLKFCKGCDAGYHNRCLPLSKQSNSTKAKKGEGPSDWFCEVFFFQIKLVIVYTILIAITLFNLYIIALQGLFWMWY